MPSNYFELNTNRFTTLLDKYATQMAVYVYKKAKLFINAFLVDTCRISKQDGTEDCTHSQDRSEIGYFWSRAEWIKTRGQVHYHTIAKIP